MSDIYHNDDEFYASCNQTMRGCQILVFAGGLHAVLSLPTVTIGVMSDLILIIVCLRTIPYLGQMNTLIIVSALFDIPFLINEAVFIGFLPKGLPWLSFNGIYFENWSHLGCKLSNYYQSFLSAGRVNILLLEAFFCHTISQLRPKQAITPNFMILPIAACLLLAALQSVPIAMTYQLWIWRDKVLCDADPLWPFAIVIATKLGQSLFCDGILPAIFILLLSMTLIMSARRVARILRWIQAFENHPCIATSALGGLHRRLYAIQLNIKLVQLHAVPIALSRIIKAVLRIEQSYLVYHPYQEFEGRIFGDRCFEVMFWRYLISILSWMEIVWSSLHFWWFYMYVPDVRKAMLKCVSCSCLKRQAVPTQAKRSHSKAKSVRTMRLTSMVERRRFSHKYYKTIETLAKNIPYEVLCRSCRSLATQNDLPSELMKFREAKLKRL